MPKDISKAKDTVKPRKSSRAPKTPKVITVDPMVEDITIPSNQTFPETQKPLVTKQFKLLVVSLVVLAVLVAGAYFLRSYYLAAWVNNRPIFRYKLNQEMTKAVGSDILENLIIQELVDQEAAKSSIQVTTDKLNQEIAKIKTTLGTGITLEDALKFQGMTMEDFQKQVVTRIKINELLAKDVSVSAVEIDQYLKDNPKTLTATDEAQRRSEAESLVRDQKISAKIQEWIKALQDKAKITRFLK